MNKYTYTDTKTKTVVLAVYAKDILEADAQLLFTAKVDAKKCAWVSCFIEFDKSQGIE